MPAQQAPPGAHVAVEVAFPQPGIAIVALRGEHDLGTMHGVREALARASVRRNVLIDLCECTFLDATVIAALLAARKALDARGGQLALVIPQEAGTVRRVAAITSLGTILPIHERRAAGIAGFA
jgi:anti-anti-sigma factor